MYRFFISSEEMQSDFLVLTGENADHAKVLRLKQGEQVCICDGQGNECLCTVSDVASGQYSLVVNSTSKSVSEPAVCVDVYMALPKADKLEHVIQKATELGATRIITFPSARSIAKLEEKSLSKKIERWQKIAASAAEQCGRGIVPQVLALKNYKEAVKQACTSQKAILFYENERSRTLQMTLNEGDFTSVSIITGPEGGLTDEEVELAVNSGVSVCTLGRRILRCETAPLCALSAIMYHSGEF